MLSLCCMWEEGYYRKGTLGLQMVSLESLWLPHQFMAWTKNVKLSYLGQRWHFKFWGKNGRTGLWFMGHCQIWKSITCSSLNVYWLKTHTLHQLSTTHSCHRETDTALILRLCKAWPNHRVKAANCRQNIDKAIDNHDKQAELQWYRLIMGNNNIGYFFLPYSAFLKLNNVATSS